MKKTMNKKSLYFSGYLVIILVMLLGCSADKNETTVTSGEVTVDRKNKSITTKDAQIVLQEVEIKEDIDGKRSAFIYADISNISEENIVPEMIWSTYLRFTDSAEGLDQLYQNVLPKKDLDGSAYKTAIDEMSRELVPNETTKVGVLYNLPQGDTLYLSVMNEKLEVMDQEKIIIP